MIVPDEVIEVRVDLKERIVEWENNKSVWLKFHLLRKTGSHCILSAGSAQTQQRAVSLNSVLSEH
jgi:hypothetical protein